MEIPFAELGIAGVAIGTLGWVVKAFLKHLKFIVKEHATTINNHLTHSVKTQERLISAVDKLHEKL